MAAYDFIVVGSGPSGSLLASKLAKSNQKLRVLLLEAGNNGLLNSSINERFTAVKTNPELNWGYQTLPQKQLEGQIIDYARGKALGGSTNINFCMWTKPSKGEFEEWADRLADSFFGWDNASRHFDAIEGYGPLDDSTWRKYGGRKGNGSGDVPLYFSSGENEANDALIDAFVNHSTVLEGLNMDLNSGQPIGTGIIPMTAREGEVRATAATVYLADAPTNLEIKKQSQAARLILDKAGTKCHGVETVLGEKFFATKDTIICCGAIDTPKLLMLSGIGPKAHLAEVGVECSIELPGVGSNLRDHPLNIFLYETTRSLEPDIRTLVLSFFRDREVLASEEAAGLASEEKRLLARATTATYEVASAFNFPPGAQVSPPNVALFSFGMTPQSVGTVRLASSDPLDSPICDPKFHAHPYDRKNAMVQTRAMLDIVENGFKGLIKAPISAPASGSDEDITAWLNKTLVSGWHMSSSVKMGLEDDEFACVDSNFKVRGLAGLRVADMSICPFLPNGHPMSVAYLIGSWAAERIVIEHGLSE